MQYLGGKSRIAKPIAAVLLAARGDRRVYLEPFLGAASVAAQVAPAFDKAVLSDVVPDLPVLFNAALAGWTPPPVITEERWRELRDAPPSPERAIAAFGCSFGGQFFASYARDPKGGRNYVRTAWNGIARRLPGLRGAEILTADYRDHRDLIGPDVLVYCDPPYAGTPGYKGAPPFDNAAFWDEMRAWAARGAAVFVSEYAAPSDWVCVWEGHPMRSLAKHHSGHARERLFTTPEIAASLT